MASPRICPRCRADNAASSHVCISCGLVFDAPRLTLSLSFWAVIAAIALALQGGAILLSGVVTATAEPALGGIFLLVGALYLLTAFAVWQQRAIGYYIGLVLALFGLLSGLTSFDSQASAATWLSLGLSAFMLLVLLRECWNLANAS